MPARIEVDIAVDEASADDGLWGSGFAEEGRMRRHIRKGDTWLDVVALAMLRDEWLAVKPGIEEKLAARGLLGGGATR